MKLLLTTALLLALTTLSARANVITVTTLSPGGAGSLWAAVQSAGAGDTIEFQTGLTGTILLTNQLNIANNLTITGPGAPVLKLNALFQNRVFQIHPGATVTISGLTISGGLNQGANGTSASRNGLPGLGGGIYNSGTLTLMYCVVINNSAVGGQGYADLSANPIGTGGVAQGGGIYSDGNGILTLFNCFISSNSVVGGNGGVTTDPVPVYGSGGASAGGGVCSISPICSLTNVTLDANFAYGGPAVNTGDGSGSGGGLSIHAGILVNCTIANNIAGGGPAYGGNSGPSGAGSGGGIDASSAGSTGVTLKSCTISGNSATGGPDGDSDGNAVGGGLDAVQSPAVVVDNTLMASNSVAGGSGGSEVLGPDVFGTVASGGFNFISESDNSTGWKTTGAGVDVLGTSGSPLNPQLGPLQNNGGPTPTIALTPGSPAIDQGKDFGVPLDQRGQPRPVRFSSLISLPSGGDASDIGAFELSPPRLNLIVHFPNINLIWSETGQFPGQSIDNPIFPSDPIFPGNPFFGLEALSGSLSGGLGTGTAFTGWVRVLNNREYMAKDIIDPTKPGIIVYGLNNYLTNNNLIPAPVTTAATAITDSGAQLNGTVTPYGPNTLYYFVWGYDTTYKLGSTPTNPLAYSTTATPVSASLGSLNASTVYHYELVTMDDDASNQVGGDVSFTTGGPPPVVTTYGATAIGATSATLNGAINGEGYNTAGFFDYGPSPGVYTNNTRNQQYLGPPNAITYPYSTTLTGLVPGATYYYRADGYGAPGSPEQYGAETNFTTANGQQPPTVTTLPVNPLGTTNATLNGSVNPNGADTVVWFEYGTSTSYGQTTTKTDIGTNAQSDFTASIGISTGGDQLDINYRIDAYNSGGTNYGTNTYFYP